MEVLIQNLWTKLKVRTIQINNDFDNIVYDLLVIKSYFLPKFIIINVVYTKGTPALLVVEEYPTHCNYCTWKSFWDDHASLFITVFEVSVLRLRNLSHCCYGRVNYAPHAMPCTAFVCVSKTFPATKIIRVSSGWREDWNSLIGSFPNWIEAEAIINV